MALRDNKNRAFIEKLRKELDHEIMIYTFYIEAKRFRGLGTTKPSVDKARKYFTNSIINRMYVL